MSEARKQAMTEDFARRFLSSLGEEGRERLLNALARYLLEEEQRERTLKQLQTI